jgi:hypothetical protein
VRSSRVVVAQGLDNDEIKVSKFPIRVNGEIIAAETILAKKLYPDPFYSDDTHFVVSTVHRGGHPEFIDPPFRRSGEGRSFDLPHIPWYLSKQNKWIKRGVPPASCKGHGEIREEGTMNLSAKNIDKKKALTGVILVCLAVFMMLFEGEATPFFLKGIRVILLSIGLGFYVWGRFFSRKDA